MISELSPLRSIPRPAQTPTLSQPFNVLFLNYEYAPMGGGAGNATHQTARRLVEQGVVVHALTSALPAESAVETVDGVVVTRVPSRRKSLLECGLWGATSYLVFALFALRRLSRVYNYDLYQFYFSLPTGLLALYVHWVLKKPYVIALRGSDVPGYDESGWYLAPLHRILRPLTRYLWRHASTVTVLSDGLMQLARKTQPDIDYQVVPNGIDGTRFPQKVGSREFSKIRLITVCRMVPRKGLDYLIEAMRELKDSQIDLWLVGGGQEQAQIAKLVQAFDLEDCVWMPGYVPRNKLTSYYQQADIFVLPSLSESFGQVLLEAMSTGLPIVATSVGGVPEIVQQDRGGIIIPPADSGAIVEAVRSLVAAPERMARMGNYNAAHVRQNYQWGSVAAAYHEIFRDVLGERIGTSVDETGRIRRIELS